MTDKDIRKIYKNFLTEKVESSRKDTSWILIWALILGGFSYRLSIYLSNLIKFSTKSLIKFSTEYLIKFDWFKKILQKVSPYLQVKLENDNIRLYSFFYNLSSKLLLWIIIFVLLSHLLCLKRMIDKRNGKIRQKNSNEKFLSYLYEKNEINSVINSINKINESKKNNIVKDIEETLSLLFKNINIPFSIVFGSELITFFIFQNMNLFLQTASFIMLFFIILKVFKVEKEKESNKKIKNYLEEYCIQKNTLDKFLSNKNNHLTVNSISKSKYKNLKEELKKIEYFYKKDKLIIFIKVEYLKVYLKEEKKIEINLENIENESKLENINYIYDSEEKSIALIVKITE